MESCVVFSTVRALQRRDAERPRRLFVLRELRLGRRVARSRAQAARASDALRPVLAAARAVDALPEHTSYADRGCEFSSSCLECPLARCRYDVAGGARVLQHEARDVEIRSRRAAGALPRAIAAALGCSERTVFRALAAG